MNNFTVYMHLFPNDKMYVGITSLKPEYRWNNGTGYSKQILMNRAINKYGWGNIEHIIIAEKLTQDEACKLEIDTIKYWNTTNQKSGYNRSHGGAGNRAIIVSMKTKEKISKAMEGRFVSLETRIKISDAQKGKNCSIERRLRMSKNRKGKTHSDETKEKLRKANLGKKLSDETKRKISESMKGKNKDIKKSEEHKRRLSEANKGKISYMIPVFQYDLEGNFIREWGSAKIAYRETGIHNSNICSCCKGKLKTAGKFIWKYNG